MKVRPKAAHALLTLFVLALACVRGARAPEVEPRGTLGLREDPSGEEAAGPLSVVFASPKGKLTGPAEITVLFNKPLRPLDVAGAEQPFPGRVEPAVPGTWQWMGTRAASFIPERPGAGGAARLPAATRFVVTVPKGTRSLDGDALAEDFSFEFETERPRVLRTAPWRGNKELEPDATFDVTFNQPMDLGEVRRATAFEVGDKPAPFEVAPKEQGDERTFTITPKNKLPLDTAVSITLREDLKGKEGNLTAAQPDAIDFRTVGPLVVTGIECSRDAPGKKCSAASGVHVLLSNDVPAKDLKRAITVEPAVKIAWPSWMDDDERVSSIFLSGNFQPGRSYTVRVAGRMQDRFGQTLRAPASSRLDFGDLWPIARIGLTNGVLEPGGKRDVLVAHINTSDLEVGSLALGEDDILEIENRQVKYDDLAKRSGFKRTKVAAGRKNVRETTRLPIGTILGSDRARGAFVVALRYTSNDDDRGERSIAQLTDLAITAKVSKAGSLVWVSRLGDASPVANAEVKIRRPGTAGVVGKTDAQGFAAFTSAQFSPSFDDEEAVIFVRSGDDVAYKPVADTLYTWDFTPDADPMVGMLFSDRRIYRPGDTARLKGILREPADTGSRSPGAGKPVSVEVQGPDGETAVTQGTTTTAFGTFSVDVKVPRTSRLGRHWVAAKIGDRVVANDEIDVAEYRAAEFKASVESDRPAYVRGDTARWTARGDYYFGAPMVGSEAELAVYRADTVFTPPGLEGLSTSDEAYWRDLPIDAARKEELVSSRAALDAKGLATASASLALPGQRGPETVSAHVDVHDVSRQVISSSTTAVVHPAMHYVGIQLADWFVPAKTRLSPRVVAATPKGDRVIGAPLRVQLLKRVWTSAKQKSGVGAATTVSTPHDVIVQACELKSAKSPVSCDLVPADAGYYIVRVLSSDTRHNPVAASQEVYVSGDSDASFAPFAESDRSDVELVADKDKYQAGDVAKVLVKSPWKSADAIITIERSGVVERRRQKIAGAAPTIQIPITDKMRPNAYVSVLLVRPRTQKAPATLDKPDLGAPAFRIGYANLRVDPEARRLAVGVKPDKTDLKPGEELGVALTVTDRAGKPAKAELTVYAVDEGVLSLVDYKTPDPIPIFGAPRPLHVATLESRGAMASLFDPLSGLGLDKGLAGGGGGEGGGGEARRDFRAAAYFNPSVVTDERGKAAVRFKLPDSLTTYRIMAVAVAADDRFGSASAQVTTSRPLMARPALPRFLRAGDTFDASVIVTSKGLAPSEIEVTAKLGGVVLKGEAHKRVRVGTGESVEVRFPAEAPKVGPASFSFTVKGGGADDAVVVERAVALPMAPEAVALYGSTSSVAAEKLGDLSAIREDAGDLTVTTASTALVGLDAGATQLLDYPYGCTEQLTSKLVPLVGMRDLAKDFRFPTPSNIDDVVDKTIAKILTHQRYDGGFGFWPESPKSHPFATVYAVWGLSEAKKKGYRVPDGALEDATRHLLGLVQRGDRETIEFIGPFALYVLAEAGKGDPGRTSTMFEKREGMPVYSKAFLLSTMVLQKSDPGSIDTLVKELEATIRLDGPIARVVENRGDAYLGYLDSETRTTAITLRALLHAKPAHPLANEIVQGLLRDRKGGTWRSTQETAWALLALGDYRRAQEKAEPDMTARLFFGEKLAAEQGFKGRSLAAQVASFPAADLVGAKSTPISFEVEGQGTLFYEARLRYVRKKLPTAPLDRGFFVEKRLRRVTPSTLDEALALVPKDTVLDFQGGDLVLADVVVVTPKPRRFVAVDDPLPAGFEAIDMRLATSSRRAAVDDDDAAENEGGGRGYAAYTKEVRDDRVVFFVDAMPAGVYRYRYLARATTIGKFIVPPTRAEEMYAPEVFGRTGAGSIAVGSKGP
jgi:hypothetical protein